MTVSRYAQVVGIAFFLGRVLGLSSTEDAFGVLNSDHAEDVLHPLTGLLLGYAEFFARRENLNAAVLYQGGLYAVLGVYGFIDPSAFGLFPNELGAIDTVIHLVEGVLGMLVVLAFGGSYRRRAAPRPAG